MKVGFFDLEANGFLENSTKIHCGVVKERGGVVKQFRPNQIPQLIAHLSSFDVLIAHNGIGYDFPMLRKHFGWIYKGKKVDTLIMSRLLNPKRMLHPLTTDRSLGPHSLGAWGYRVGRGKPDHEDWSTFSEEMLHRCTEDVEILELVYEELLKEAKGYNWRNAFLLSFELFEYLQQQEEYGWLVDKQHMGKCVRQLTKWIERIDRVITPKLPKVLEVQELKKAGEYNYVRKPFLKSGEYSSSVVDWCSRNNIAISSRPVGGCFTRIDFRDTDLNSGAETKEFLLGLGWEPLEWNEDDDGNRTSPKLSKDDPFEGIESKIGKLVAKRVQCRQRRSIVEGLMGLVRPDGRISSVISTLAVTGRGIHRNIVNIPKPSSFYGKQMRQVFSSQEGFVLVGTDSAGNQLRQLAARMGSEDYIKSVISGVKEDGTDVHSITKKVGDLESRDIAKNTMYCLLFGGGDEKLARTAKKPRGSGAELRLRLYTGLSGLGELMERLTKEWRSTAKQRYNPDFKRMEYYNGKIIGLDGRPISVTSEHQLLVYLLQSDEAIHMSKAYCLFSERLNAKYKRGVDYGVVCFYHDEFTAECRKEIADDVKQIAEQAIADAGTFYNIKCPHEGEGSIGKNWYDIH